MKGLIRKISIGQDYPNGVMHYQVGKTINLGGNYFKIRSIESNIENGKKVYDIFISSDTDTILWKSIIDVPVVVEFKIDFE